MNNEEILKKAIEKAVKNGWKCPDEIAKTDMFYGAVPLTMIIFNPEWAKAFFGEKTMCYDCGEYIRDNSIVGRCICGRQFENNVFEWDFRQHELLDEIQAGRDPIKYLEQFLD